MIKLKLNWFQGWAAEGDAAKIADTQDGDDDGFISFTTSTGQKITIPEAVYNKIGSQIFEADNNDKVNYANAYVDYYVTNGKFPDTEANFKTWAADNGYPIGTDTNVGWGELNADLRSALVTSINTGDVKMDGTVYNPRVSNTGINVDTSKTDAFNQYYQDVYSLQPGTAGSEMLGRLEESYLNQAQQAATIADVQFQQAALQQAQTVKQITDQVRGERMARLRAGMSESQIANQDMQMLMTNVNTLNQNANMLNQQRLQAQVGMNTAQDQAYTDFLTQANARGQVASAFAASDAGDPYQQTIKQMTALYGNDPSQWTDVQWKNILERVTGYDPDKK